MLGAVPQVLVRVGIQQIEPTVGADEGDEGEDAEGCEVGLCRSHCIHTTCGARTNPPLEARCRKTASFGCSVQMALRMTGFQVRKTFKKGGWLGGSERRASKKPRHTRAKTSHSIVPCVGLAN